MEVNKNSTSAAAIAAATGAGGSPLVCAGASTKLVSMPQARPASAKAYPNSNVFSSATISSFSSGFVPMQFKISFFAASTIFLFPSIFIPPLWLIKQKHFPPLLPQTFSLSLPYRFSRKFHSAPHTQYSKR